MNTIKNLLFFLFIGTFGITANPTRHKPTDGEYPIVTITHKSNKDSLPSSMGILTVEKNANDINDQKPLKKTASVAIYYKAGLPLEFISIAERTLETVECEIEYATGKEALILHYFFNPDSKYIELNVDIRNKLGQESFAGLGFVHPSQERAIFEFANGLAFIFHRKSKDVDDFSVMPGWFITAEEIAARDDEKE
jgi:hypothetical protein